MNIAFVISIKIWGGVKTWMVEFGRELQKRGHRVIFYAADPKMIDEVKKNECEGFFVKFGSDYSPRKIRFFYHQFKKKKIDATCMNIQKEIRTAGVAAKLLNIPVIQRIGLPSDLNYRLDQRLAQRFLVDEILVTSKWMKRETINRIDYVPEDKYTIIYNSKPEIRTPREHIQKPVRFVITSRLAEGKGHIYLIKAFSGLQKEGFNNFTCDIFGTGPLEDPLQAYIQKSNLGERIRLKGFSRNLNKELLNYDFGILTSKVEGLANTIIECFSASLPVIATNSGAIPELVEENKNGFMFQYTDVETLILLLKKCLEMDDSKYQQFSYQANNIIKTRFNLQKNVQKLEDYFSRCIEKDKSQKQIRKNELKMNV